MFNFRSTPTPMCSDCGYDRCLCHTPKCRKCRLPLHPLGCKWGQRSAEATIAPDTLVTLGSVAPLAEDGLIIEGIGTTRDWNAIEVPLAAGLTRLDGSTTRRRGGLNPRKMKVELPLPLLWYHDEKKPLGEMFAASATENAVHFRAVVVPPGTPGYDSDLLEQVWTRVRSGDVCCVSFASDVPDEDGSWRGKELSVCQQGGNPFAIITRATFPDQHIVERAAPSFNREDAQRAWLEFDEKHRQHVRQSNPAALAAEAVAQFRARIREVGIGAAMTEIARDKREAEAPLQRVESVSDGPGDDEPPARYRKVWEAGKKYYRGDFVTHSGTTWYANGKTTTKPGESRDWTLMAKGGLSNAKAARYGL